jgi:hypothetical protein
MASLALGLVGAVVGFYVGGPVGASIGWSLGSVAGSALDPPKSQGPRLSDLKLQGSTYGAMIPILYGTCRMAGNVIDQTDLTEHSHTEGGKGGPEVTTFTYSASFAIQICEGPIVAVRKIWADGRLIWDTTPGTTTSALNFTLYLGTETQGADPTFEAIHGAGNVPAYRGTAYVVFPDLDLSDFGNRIPMMTFEVLQKAHTNGALRITAVNNAEPITYHSGFLGGTGEYPVIYDWPPTGTIVAGGIGSGSVAQYDEDLTYDSTTPRSSEQDFPVYTQLIDPSPYTQYDYYGVGMYLLNSNRVPVWICHDLPVGSGAQFPALAAVDVFLDGSGFPVSSNEIAFNAGIPTGELVWGVNMTLDETAMFAFTAPSGSTGGSSSINKWYKIVEGLVADSGTVSPALSIADIGFGTTTQSAVFACSQFENNQQWCWQFYGAGSGQGGTARVYEIDDANNFALNTVCGSLESGDLNPFIKGAIRVIAEGFAGVVAGATLAIYTRFPINDSIKVPLSEIVGDVSTRSGLDVAEYDTSDLGDLVDGYIIASQMTGRNAISPLQSLYFFDGAEIDDQVVFVKRGQDSIVTIEDDDLAARTYGEELPTLISRTRKQEVELPRIVNIVYLNPDADYQNNTQIAQRQTGLSEDSTTIQAPVVLTDTKAKQVADALLYTAWQERDTYGFTTSRKFVYLTPCDVVTVGGKRLRIENMVAGASGVLTFTAKPSSASIFEQASIAGTATGFVAPVVTSGQLSELELLDIPIVDDSDVTSSTQAVLYAAMAGQSSTHWRGAALFKSSDGGSSYSSIASTSTADSIGDTSTALGDFLGGNIFDEANVVTVTLHAGAGELSSVTESAVLSGSNMALIGNEIVAYKNAVLTGERTYDLSGFLRGRRGTEWAIGTHGLVERFVALPAATVLVASQSELSVTRSYKPVTSGGSLSASAATDFANLGQALRPYAVALVGGGVNASGDFIINWVRRTRLGGGWDGLTEVPLSEASELYTVEIWDSTYATLKRTVTGLTTTTTTYTAAQQTTDFGSPQSSITVKVYQIGAYLPSRATRATIPNATSRFATDTLEPQPIPGTPPPLPAGTHTIAFGTVVANTIQQEYSSNYGGFGPLEMLVASFTTPASGSSTSCRLAIVEFTDPPVYRLACLSTTPGDMNNGIKLEGTGCTFYFTVGTAVAGFPTLATSTTYYLNLRNGPTNAGSCNVQLTLSIRQ